MLGFVWVMGNLERPGKSWYLIVGHWKSLKMIFITEKISTKAFFKQIRKEEQKKKNRKETRNRFSFSRSKNCTFWHCKMGTLCRALTQSTGKHDLQCTEEFCNTLWDSLKIPWYFQFLPQVNEVQTEFYNQT